MRSMNSQMNARQLALDAAVVLLYAACGTMEHAIDSVLIFRLHVSIVPPPILRLSRHILGTRMAQFCSTR